MQYVMDVIHSTADNVSSMLQDIRNQRHTGSTTSPVTCCAALAAASRCRRMRGCLN